MDFINQISIACSSMLQDDIIKYTDAAYDMTRVKCVNLFLPNMTTYNTEIIERELKETQDQIFMFITSCEYAVERERIKALKKHAKQIKHKTRIELYNLIGREVTQ